MTSLVVVLSGPEGDRRAEGRHPISAPEEAFAGARYTIDRVYHRSSRELAERAGAFWLVFSPLAADAEAATVAEAVRTAKERAPEEHFAALASTMTALAGVAPERDVFLEAFMGQINENLLTHNPLFERGVDVGVKQGHKAGAIEAMHDALLMVLQSRALRVIELQRACIVATDDRATLDAWLSAAGTAATTGEVLQRKHDAAPRARKGR